MNTAGNHHIHSKYVLLFDQTKLLPRPTLIQLSDVCTFRSLARDCWAALLKELKMVSPNCLLLTSKPVFNLMRWSSSMEPIKFAVTSLIPCWHGWNQSAAQFRFWTDSHILEMRLPACVTRGLSLELYQPVSMVYFIKLIQEWTSGTRVQSLLFNRHDHPLYFLTG